MACRAVCGFPKPKPITLAKLVRWHQQPISLMDDGITDSAVRRLIVNLSEELNDLLILGQSDITTGNPLKKEKRLKNYDRLKNASPKCWRKINCALFSRLCAARKLWNYADLNQGPR